MKTVSWVLLTVAVILVLLIGLASMQLAYFAPASNDQIIESTTLADLEVSGEVVTALRGRRATAAAFALAFGFLLLLVVIGPYRKGDTWAWWAILLSTLVPAVIMLLRIPALDTSRGAMTGLSLFVVVLIALLFDVRRMTGGVKSAGK